MISSTDMAPIPLPSQWPSYVGPMMAKILSARDVNALITMAYEYARHHVRDTQQRYATVKVVWWMHGPAAAQHFPANQPWLDQDWDAVHACQHTNNGIWISEDATRMVTLLTLPHHEVAAYVVVDVDPVGTGQVVSQQPLSQDAKPSPTLVVPEGWEQVVLIMRPCMSAVFDMTRLRQAELIQQALFKISDLASSGLDMPSMLPRMHAVVGELMYAENFYIALYDSNKDCIRFIYYRDVVDPDPVSDEEDVFLKDIERGLTWYLIRDAKPLRGSSPQLRQQVSGPLEDHGPDSMDWMGVPILSNDGHVRGVLVVQSYVERPRYTEQDQALLSFLGSHIFNALERSAAQQELERRVRERTSALQDEVLAREQGERLQQTLFRIAQLANSASSQDDFYAQVHRIVGDWMNSNNFYVAHVSDDGKSLEFPYSVDELDPPRQPRPIGKSMTDYVIRTGKPFLGTRDAINALKDSGEVVELGAKSVCWLGVPLTSAGRILGALAVQSYTPGRSYTFQDQELLTFIATQVANALQRLRATQALKDANLALEARVAERTNELLEQISVREAIEQQLKHEVLHDNLTGLPNRAYLREHLQLTMGRYRRHRDRQFAVVFMDLDRFKVINDSAGHLVGDELLKEVAKRFSSCVRPTDIVARLGGDEFAMILDELHGPEDAVHVTQRAIASLKAPILVDHKELFTGVSAGIVMMDDRYTNPDDLLRDADVAMYRAKANSQQRFEIFDEALHKEALQLLDLENELRQGMLRHEFAPHLQPIVRLLDGQVQGYEALMRWNHPQRGVLTPAVFLRVAEAAGCLEDMDWMMFEAVMQGPAQRLGAGQYINVNISPRHFKNAAFAERFLRLMQRYNLDASKIRVELTEGALVDNHEQARLILETLRDNSVLAALDDFGTGYSSLSYVHQFPLHTLKIDRSFVTGLAPNKIGSLEQFSSAYAVVKSIIALANSLNLEVVAEGIETEHQRQSLMELGCAYGQGFALGKVEPPSFFSL